MKAPEYKTTADFNSVLPKETAALYKVVKMGTHTSTVVNFPKIGTIDFSTLSVKHAEALILKKFPFIELKTKEKPKTEN